MEKSSKLGKVYECSENTYLKDSIPVIEDPNIKLTELVRGLNEIAYFTLGIATVLQGELNSQKGISLDLSTEHITKSISGILEQTNELIRIAEKQDLETVILRDSVLTEWEMSSVALSIALQNFSFIRAHNRAAVNYLRASQAKGQDFVPVSQKNHSVVTRGRLKEYQHHLSEILNSNQLELNYQNIIDQLLNISHNFSEISKNIDPGDPLSYFSDQNIRDRFNKCLGLSQYFILLIKNSWKNYKLMCREQKVEPSSKLVNVLNTAQLNYLTKFLIYDFPKASGLPISDLALGKYETVQPPEVLALSPEDRKNSDKMKQAMHTAYMREKQEKRDQRRLKKNKT